MRIGIVGSEGAKFTKKGKQKAKHKIAQILSKYTTETVISGGCHLGGIDKWAIQVGKKLGWKGKEFLPKNLSWSGGYKERNLQIAQASDIVYCISVDKLPKDFTGMRFNLCYHCGKKNHVKSGGCWTMKKAIEMGKKGKLIIIKN